MYATLAESADRELVEAVRAGDDSAFEELYRRYQPRIAAFLRRKVGDPARAEDIAQDAFVSALRRLRATDTEIDFKPWVFQIATNAAIDHWRRTSRAEEVSVDADEGMRQSDRARLTGSAGPDSVLVDKERFEHLRGAFDELSDMHTRILVMREFEGLSYREIAEQLDVSRGSVESTLFRARRRLESEYEDISEGRRCVAMRGVIARIGEVFGGDREAERTPGAEQRGTGSGTEAGANRSPAEHRDLRPGGAAGEPGQRGGGPRSGGSGDGARSDQAAAGAAGGPGADGSARGTEAPGAGTGSVGLPGIPDVSPGAGAGGPSGPGADLPRLPEAPSGPGLPEAPSGPRDGLPRLPEAPSAPRVEEPQALEPPANLGTDSGPSVPVAPPSVPAEPPATPELPQLGPGGSSAP